MKKNVQTPRPAAQYTSPPWWPSSASAPKPASLKPLWSSGSTLSQATSASGYDEHHEGIAETPSGGKKRGKRWAARERQIPTVIERGRLRIQLSDAGHLSEGSSFVGCIILSCDRRNIRARLCAESNGAVIDARAWALLVVPPRAFAPRPLAKEVDRALSVPDADGEIRTSHYDIIQVSDGTVVTLYCWTHLAKGPIWCLASING